MHRIKQILISFILVFPSFVQFVSAQDFTDKSKFKQLDQEFPTPNTYRTASGAPGHEYWQQKADYQIAVSLDDEKQVISGKETITYHNNSPDPLTYLWVQLDQNIRKPGSMTELIKTQKLSEKGISLATYFELYKTFPGGFHLDYVKDHSAIDLNITVNNTMMRIDLKDTLYPGGECKINIGWWYNINDRIKYGGRSGYEYFPEDNNYLYTIAQFFPRMAVYSDVEGWQNKQFLGKGEFALPFGDYDVSITLPSDMVVGATGEIQNKDEVLTAIQQERLEMARNSDTPVMIITENEARQNEKNRANDFKTWRFKAENVRDFGWAASRKFLWDAQGVKFGERTVMAMSLYPKEGNPLWEKYSTKAVALTLEVYSKHTFDYPYPVAYSVHSKDIGMEYPMICFNFGRPNLDGSYSDQTKYRMLMVIIHEVGHNFFPMIVNSDERQWTWMDEGLNTFLQYLTEKEWQDETGKEFPSARGPAKSIIPYMSGDKRYISPIMTNSESIWQLGNNAYGKPCTALNILRETVMGQELFDFAFKEYANRWKFKHPTPSDFFRTMEDASAVDLDWFWRGWFYTTNHVDIALTNVVEYQKKELRPEINQTEKSYAKMIAKNKEIGFFDPIVNTMKASSKSVTYDTIFNALDLDQKAELQKNDYFYYCTFENKGLVMPLILGIEFNDGTSSRIKIPAEIWVMQDEVNKVFVTSKKVKKIVVDPDLETADINVENNFWINQR